MASDAQSSCDPHSLSRKADLLFCRGDEPWSSHRPGIVYIVPTRYATVDNFKAAHLSRYMRNKLKLPYIKKPYVKSGNRRLKYVKSGKPRKAYTIKNPVEYARKSKQNGAMKYKQWLQVLASSLNKFPFQ